MRRLAPTLAITLSLVALPLHGCGESNPAPPPTSPDAEQTDQRQAEPDTPTAEEAAPVAHAPEPETVEPTEPATDPLAAPPPRFTDHAPQYRRVGRNDGEDESVEVEPVPFDMIRIPGDEAHGIEPFYMGETEVTWDMIESWGYCRDIADWEEAMRLIGEGLRPSWLDGGALVIYEMDKPGRPVVGATRHTAELFCRWLAEKTGRRYRRPTPEEWAHALRASGGFPGDTEELLKIGSFLENPIAPDDELFGPADPFADVFEYPIVSPVKRHPPNALGIYDLLGNAGEWVAVPGGEAYLMGGHFAVPAAEMTADWTDAEDLDVWNAVFPMRPRFSQFWYWGQHHFQGFRLVCEVE